MARSVIFSTGDVPSACAGVGGHLIDTHAVLRVIGVSIIKKTRKTVDSFTHNCVLCNNLCKEVLLATEPLRTIGNICLLYIPFRKLFDYVFGGTHFQRTVSSAPFAYCVIIVPFSM